MDAENYHKLLEDKFLTYAELSKIPVIDNHEPMVCVGPAYGISILSIDDEMMKYTGKDIFVRKSVAVKLREAQYVLDTLMPNGKLQLVYGYRHLDIQKKMFEQIRNKLLNAGPYDDEEQIRELVHFSVAVPDVAGHPTGGAVDVRTLRDGLKLDMGTEVDDFSKTSYVHSPFISRSAWHNRQILRICMTTVGFAPCDAEWWHFSYGDREWAKYYDCTHAIYDQLAFQVDNNPQTLRIIR